MPNINLEKYLKTMVEIETTKYTLEGIVANLSKKYNEQHVFQESPPRKVSKPYKQEYGKKLFIPPPQNPYMPYSYRKRSSINGDSCAIVFVALIGIFFAPYVAVGFIYVFANYIFLPNLPSNLPDLTSLYNSLTRSTKDEMTNEVLYSYLFSIISLVLCTIVIVLIISALSKRSKRKKKEYWNNYYEKQYQKEMAEYNEKIKEYDKQFQAYQSRLNDFNRNEDARKAILLKQYNEATQALEKQEKLRQEYYSLGIIPPEYQDLVPVSMFYQYIKNKQTYSIERSKTINDPGAINMYREEVRMYSLISSINELRQDMNINLMRIQQHQMCLYNALEESREDNQQYMESINRSLSQSQLQQQQLYQEQVRSNYLAETLVHQNQYRNDLLTWKRYGYW